MQFWIGQTLPKAEEAIETAKNYTNETYSQQQQNSITAFSAREAIFLRFGRWHFQSWEGKCFKETNHEETMLNIVLERVRVSLVSFSNPKPKSNPKPNPKPFTSTIFVSCWDGCPPPCKQCIRPRPATEVSLYQSANGRTQHAHTHIHFLCPISHIMFQCPTRLKIIFKSFNFKDWNNFIHQVKIQTKIVYM